MGADLSLPVWLGVPGHKVLKKTTHISVLLSFGDVAAGKKHVCVMPRFDILVDENPVFAL